MQTTMNKPALIDKRKKLRNQSTTAEATLWQLLKDKQIANLKFRRQHSVGNYIIDFYCPSVRLAIELDGESHSMKSEYDDKRTLFLNEHQITVLRFENRVVFENAEQIYREIEAYIEVFFKINHV
jgi:very-short-patch-repair endonuclease